ncbi:hypothetical protein PR202_ga29853 [Eleusine coracana subsp. coracana]|uniref:Prephenate dehydratase domain-containing protein n=1 Tax=Eleusine coracana subsp. coracana TaxID=191504 RepID=A0AAV5DLX1_ELECO|nr:hypothetical protein PR202_ga29853 [Eleusine coracana subsp. coracana]
MAGTAPPFCISLRATAAMPSRMAACPATTRPNRRLGFSPSAGRAKMRDDDQGNIVDDAPPRSFVAPGTITSAGKLSVKGPLPFTDLSLGREKSQVRVAYQIMALKAFPECTAIPFKRFEKAFKAVESSLADVIVLPIENSSSGSFHQSYHFLLCHNLQIVQEMIMDVELCLLALPGVQKDDLQIIFSHPQDLAQCEHSFSNLGVSKMNVHHGADGAQRGYLFLQIISKQNLRDAGVIGSALLSELYGLNILECNFQIESRPNKGKPMRTLGTEKLFNYTFYVDFEASMAEFHAQSALKDLKVNLLSSAFVQDIIEAVPR